MIALQPNLDVAFRSSCAFRLRHEAAGVWHSFPIRPL